MVVKCITCVEHLYIIHVSATCITPVFLQVLYTGTRLYRNTGLVASRSEPVFSLLSIRYSFRYIFSPKYFKMHEVYVFCGEQGPKLERQLFFGGGGELEGPLFFTIGELTNGMKI